ncbi:hypothetical protein OIU34_23885 [Pararhizobium sp. BT-229]|uniref:hypothetical protein n=1 Tax=Pararhizobium sp. BT-229 TaxID=2986923 RepID=UPI0021F799BC|nr:hypothetical protein [Pararhizobium sp. BT-229]MCV9964939.1 hypothetical protein [Pararhizobium sp. BT-229]
MTTQINKGDLFLGLPTTKLKAVLNAFEKGKRHPAAIGQTSKIQMTPGLVAAMVGESRERGLIEMRMPRGAENGPAAWIRPALTDAGEAVASASARKRSSKQAAAVVLDDILRNAQCLLKDKKAPMEVEQIWVFGSFVDPDKPDVGDLDVAITERRKDGFREMSVPDMARHIDRHYPGIVPDSVDIIDADDHFLRRMVYGTRKHPLVSPCSFHVMQGLHRPCALVFDRQRGGIIPPQHYSHHPDSKGRSDKTRNRLVMPNLSEATESFSLTHAEILSRRFLHGGHGGDDLITDTTDLDGRHRFAVSLDSEDGTTSVTVQVTRKVSLEAGTWHYDCEVSLASTLENAAAITSRQEDRLTMIVGTIYAADILRLADRRDKLAVFPTITANMTVAGGLAVKRSLYRQLREAAELRPESDETIGMAERHSYGVELQFNRNRVRSVAPPSSFSERDWRKMEDVLPFDRDEYRRWMREHHPDYCDDTEWRPMPTAIRAPRF